MNLIHASQRNTIDLVWSSHQEKTRFQLLKENNALAAVRTSQHDQHSSLGDGGAKFGLTLGESAVQRLWHTGSCKEAGCLACNNWGLSLVLKLLHISHTTLVWHQARFVLANPPGNEGISCPLCR